jgi:hypothetical protein
MEQTEGIKHLIMEGTKKLQENEKEANDRREKINLEIGSSWIEFVHRVEKVVLPIIHDALYFKNAIDLSNMAPDLLCKTLGNVELHIDKLAPIYLRFNASNDLDCYLVPAIDNSKLQWTATNATRFWMDGTKVIETNDLALALAMAERHYLIYHQVCFQVFESEPKQEPVYAPVADNADQQVLTGIRAIIREEIHNLACGD